MSHKQTRPTWSLSSILVLLFLFATQPLLADNYVIYVGPKASDAYAFAQSKEDGQYVFAERTFHRALTKASKLLETGEHTVIIGVAAGTYLGKAKQGVWMLPQIDNPSATLIIMGGYNDDFSGRQPFGLLTALQTIYGRNGAFIQVAKKSRLKKLVISGFLLDAAPSNKYDEKTNSILKGQSRSYPLLTFAQLKTEHLVIDSNIFINGAHGAFDPFISPLSRDGSATVDITNNFFINNIKTMKPHAAKSSVAINLRNNSFIMNWPFNPDPTSSNVSAIELYHSGGMSHLTVEKNIFAYNPGGAMQHDWPEDRMPEMTFKENLFFMNGTLFGDGDPGAGVIAGKLGLNPQYLVMDLETLEDDFDYNVEGNVSMDPQIPIALADLQAADSYSVNRQNTVVNDVRRIFGQNQDGGTVSIANYAPATVFNPRAVSLPQNEAAKGYGVQATTFFRP